MRILFISSAEKQDYQCDMLFHGLRSLLGDDVVDVNRLWYMYREDVDTQPGIRDQLYGRGFSIYGLLSDDSNVDRTDIRSKLSHRYFDLVVYGSIRRCDRWLSDVAENYRSDEIIFIDGEDDQHIACQFLGRGRYYKRELREHSVQVRPIHFGIPREKCYTINIERQNTCAYIYPGDRSTYIYVSESDYYADYASSKIAITTRKAGWDCLRHYEIAANGCFPHFLQLAACPAATMCWLPKDDMIGVSHLLNDFGLSIVDTPRGRAALDRVMPLITAKLFKDATTEALAFNILDGSCQRNV